MMDRLSAWILKLMGWRITGRYPYELPKVIIAVAPHTSGWDVVLGVLVRAAARIKARFVGKHTLFLPPHGWFFRRMGGLPVDRRTRNNFVSAVVELFNKHAHLHLAIAPEGTRERVEKLKSGFYHIARQASAPILLVKMDWAKKEINFGEIFTPGIDPDSDLAYIWNYFKGVPGKWPEKSIL